MISELLLLCYDSSDALNNYLHTLDLAAVSHSGGNLKRKYGDWGEVLRETRNFLQDGTNRQLRQSLLAFTKSKVL